MTFFLILLTGVYEVSCRVTDHYSAGMRQLYRVHHCPGLKVKSTHTEPTNIVQYFISAEEIEWDYSPERTWELLKHHATLENRCVIAALGPVISGVTYYCLVMEANWCMSPSPGSIFVAKGKNNIGSRYKKVVYREYTDETFKVQKVRQPNQQHLGILGKLRFSRFVLNKERENENA